MFFFSSRRRHTRSLCDWSSDVCSSDLYFGIPQPGMADMSLFGLAKFPDHGLDFASDISDDGLQCKVGGRRFVNKARVHERLIALHERTHSRDQITIHE